jgi:phage replication O-like protein O
MGGWTQTPNFIYDLMPEMKEAEIKVVMAIVRETIGWKRDAISLSLSDLQRLTKMARASVNSGIQAAMKRGILDRTEDGQSYIYKIVEPLTKCELVQNLNHLGDETSSKSEPEVVQNLDRELVQNLDPIQRNIYTNKIKEPRERRAPASLPSPREPASKTVQHKSPHLDPRHFVNGFVPQGAGVTAVEVYYERFSINQDSARLNAIKEDDLCLFCKDLDKLREVVVAYSRTPFQLGNVQLILDWYRDGIPEKHRTPTNGQPKPGSLSEAEKGKIITRAKNAQSSIKTAQQFKGHIDPAWQEAINTAKGYGLL